MSCSRGEPLEDVRAERRASPRSRVLTRGWAAGGASPSPRAAPPGSCGRGSARRRDGRARAARRAPSSPSSSSRSGARRRPAPRARRVAGRSTGTSTPWSDRQPFVVRLELLARLDDARVDDGARLLLLAALEDEHAPQDARPGCAARPTPFASCISRLIRSTSRSRSSSKSSTSCARMRRTGSGHWRICASASRRRASRSPSSCSSSTWPWSCSVAIHGRQCSQTLWGSTSTTAAQAGLPHRRRRGGERHVPARAASAPGRSVFATSCAR